MIFLRLFCVFATVQSEIHNLHYIYTALSKPISQPGIYQFTSMGILDDRQIDFCNSTDKVKMPMQKWMEEHNETDYSMKRTQSRRRMEQWFDFSIKILKDHMQQNKPDPDVRILQWMHGCQAEKTPDGKLKFHNGFDLYGYDGEDFLVFDSENMVWVAPVPAAESTKKAWDESAFSQHTKEYLETDCVHWLEKLLKHQEQNFQTFSPPDVYIFSKTSTSPDYCTLVCLATGFYHKDVAVYILKDGVPLAESDGVASSGVRPNGERKETYQQKKWLEVKASDTSKYSCRIQHRTLPSPIKEFWDGKCCNCDGDNTGAIVGGVVVLLIVLVTVPVVLYILHRRNNAGQAPANHHLNGVRTGANGSNGSVESGGCGTESTDSGGPEEVNLTVDAAQAAANGLNQPLTGRGSTDSDEPKEEVTEPLMGNAAQAAANGLNQPLTEVNPETKGSTRSVESGSSGPA